MYNQCIPENFLSVIVIRNADESVKCTGKFYSHSLGDNINTYKTHIYI